VFVQAFVAEPRVERFDIGVLIRLARLDQPQGKSTLVRPCQQRAPAELRAVVGAQDLREPARGGQLLEHARDRQSAEGASRHDRYGLGGGIIDDGQALQLPALGRAIESKSADHTSLRRCRSKG